METPRGTSAAGIAYAAAIFLGALLLFQIQPLVSKQILPWFGGSPSVWTTCLLFFQTLLLAGYAYAHVSHAWLRPRQQAVVHIMLLAAAALLLLPGVLPAERSATAANGDPVWQILLMLTVSIGLPYFVLAATGPLLQAWFSRIFPGRVPYRLYALSNVGSLVALLSYPFLLERLFDLPRQARIWSWGFATFALMCGYAAARFWAASIRPQEPAVEVLAPRPGWRACLLWMLLPALACVVLLATTNHVSTDIAATPFLWVAPLALYLVTFIIAFDHARWYQPILMAPLALAAIYGAGLVHKEGVGSTGLYDWGTPGRLYRLLSEIWFEPLVDRPLDEPPEFRIGPRSFLALNFGALFGICMLCHGELVRQRPQPKYLTAFYLMIAAGGALGGVFVTLVAPRLFATFFEWELSLFVGALFALGLVLRSFVNFGFDHDGPAQRAGRYLWLPSLGLIVFLPAAMVLLDLTEFLQPREAAPQFRVRNFFGTLAVHERAADNGRAHQFVLRHGAITHGAQFTHPTRRREPTTYFSPASGVGRTLQFFGDAQPAGGVKIGAIGLGVGTLAAYAQPGDAITFYELNPAVIDMAESGRWFTYLKDCRERGGQYRIKLGDARLSLASELQDQRPPRFHVLVLDAFSGDSIPMHLLTAEAFETYLAHLVAAGDSAGALAVHISNRFVDLEPVVRGVAEHFDLRAIHIENGSDSEQGVYSSDWIILSGNESLMRELSAFGQERPSSAKPAILWTDKRSSLFDVLK